MEGYFFATQFAFYEIMMIFVIAALVAMIVLLGVDFMHGASAKEKRIVVGIMLLLTLFGWWMTKVSAMSMLVAVVAGVLVAAVGLRFLKNNINDGC